MKIALIILSILIFIVSAFVKYSEIEIMVHLLKSLFVIFAVLLLKFLGSPPELTNDSRER